MSPRIRARRLNVVFGLVVLVMGMLGGVFALFGATAQAANLSCPSGTSAYKVDDDPLEGLSNGQSTQYTVSGVTFTFTMVDAPGPFHDETFDFTSTTAVSAVLVKGGANTNVYNYDPAVTSGSGLHPPLNGGDEVPDISHVTFCIGVQGTTTTSTTVPGSSTSTSTTTTAPDNTSTSTTSTSTTSTTVPKSTTTTSTTVPESTSTTSTTTSTTVPDETTTSTTVPDETTTSTTVPDETTTSTTVPEETTTSTTVPEETTTTPTTVLSATTIVTTTTQGNTTTTLREQGGTVPTTTKPLLVTVPGRLPRTGSDSALAALFGLACVVAGGLLMIRKRSWSRP